MSDGGYGQVSGKNIVPGVVSQSTASTSTPLPGVPGKRCFVVGVCLSAAGAVNVTIQDENATVLSGPFPLSTGGSFSDRCETHGFLFVSAKGKGIQVVTSAAVLVGGHITAYYE